MGFLFPLFLLAALALVIPVLIHLFNLRRYKRVNFPDTRFLRTIQLSTKRQSQLRDKRLLATRLLFVAALVLAFAQPFLGGRQANGTKAALTVIYIDNSYSMGIGDGQESLLQQAGNKARQLIGAASRDTRFLVLSNDKLSATRPMMAQEALQALSDIKPVARSVSLKQLMGALTAAQQNEKGARWDIFLFSDLQQSTLAAGSGKMPLPANATLYVYPLQATKASNLYIDTAYFLSPVLDTRQPMPVVVRVKQSGAPASRGSNLQLSVGGQVRAVSAIPQTSDSAWVDTLALQLSGSGWQDITLALRDHPLSFDDTFRIAARTAPDLSVLVVTEGAVSPYLQAAFRTYQGFRVQQEPLQALRKDTWRQYSLIVLQNISQITPALQEAVKEALQHGQNVLLFPGAIANTASYSDALKMWGDITLDKEDTVRQQVVSLQQAHPLLQDIFEKVPENVQLPVTARRYPIEAGLTANQQSLMSFRDGKPFLAQYSLQQGNLYLCASALEERSTNFAVSYFFVPVLYKMAVQSGGSNIYAMESGSNKPLWLPVSGADDRKAWHLSRSGFDAIPSQRPSGVGVELFLGSVVKEPGFYRLYSEASPDSVHLGLNTARAESDLTYISQADFATLLQPLKVHWLDERKVGTGGWHKGRDAFPLWKIAVALALLGLAGETWLLLRKRRPSGEPVAA